MPKTFNKPNLKAPRHHREALNILKPPFFRLLKKKYPQFKPYTASQLRAVIWQSNIALYKTIIEHRDGVELPESLGNVFIGSCPKAISPNADIKCSVDHGQLIEHRNFESDMFFAKIFYTNYERKYSFKFNDLWAFKGCRNFGREVSRTYPKTWKKYIQVDHTLKISRLYRTEKRRLSVNIKTAIFLENYNEFEGF